MTDKAESAPRSCKPVRDCYQKTNGQIPSLAESRLMLLRYLKHHITLDETSGHLLRVCARQIATIVAATGLQATANAAVLRIAIERQRLLNQVGLRLAPMPESSTPCS